MTTTLIMGSIGELFTGMSIFGLGIALGTLFLTIAFSRSLTTNKNHWALAISAICNTFAMAIPDYYIGGICMVVGMISTIIAFMGMLSHTSMPNEQRESVTQANIIVIAILMIIMNIVINVQFSVYNEIGNFNTDYDNAIETITGVFSDQISTSQATYGSKLQLCTANEVNADGEACVSNAIQGSFLPNVFVPLATVFAMGLYGGIAVALAGASIVAIALFQNISSLGILEGMTIIKLLITFFVLAIQVSVLYKAIKYFTNGWGTQ